jgi:hypothetical protein
MNAHTDRPARVESADSRRAAAHAQRTRLANASSRLGQALQALSYSNSQEAQEARLHILLAAESLGWDEEGLARGESVGPEDEAASRG